MATAKRKEAPDILKTKVVNIMELRLALAGLSDIEEISIYDLLLFVKGLAKNKE